MIFDDWWELLCGEIVNTCEMKYRENNRYDTK
jgi:hypothetical protein